MILYLVWVVRPPTCHYIVFEICMSEHTGGQRQSCHIVNTDLQHSTFCTFTHDYSKTLKSLHNLIKAKI